MKKFYNNNNQLIAVDLNTHYLCISCNVYVCYKTAYNHILGIKHLKYENKNKLFIKKSQFENEKFEKIKNTSSYTI